MAKKRKRIVCSHGVGKEIAKELGVSEVTVSSALNFITDSILATQIKEMALTKYKGTLVEISAKKKKSKIKKVTS